MSGKPREIVHAVLVGIGAGLVRIMAVLRKGSDVKI
jgi:hypothetical protein